jgi:hypothetical protein
MATPILSYPSPTRRRILADRLQTRRHTLRAHTTGLRTDSPLLPSLALLHLSNRLIYLQGRAIPDLEYLPRIRMALQTPQGRIIWGHLILANRIQANRGLEFLGCPILATLARRMALHRRIFQERGPASRLSLKADADSQIPSTAMNLEVAVGMDMAHTSQNTKLERASEEV